MTRNVTDGVDTARFVLYSFCTCDACGASGWAVRPAAFQTRGERCPACRGEGRVRREIASATDEQSLGLALITCAREGEWAEGCPLGLLDREGEVGQKWLISGWAPSARNVTDAARTLAKSKTKEKP